MGLGPIPAAAAPGGVEARRGGGGRGGFIVWYKKENGGGGKGTKYLFTSVMEGRKKKESEIQGKRL